MALVNCPECGSQVSEFSQKCPRCGMSIGRKIFIELLNEKQKCESEERKLDVKMQPLNEKKSALNTQIDKLQSLLDTAEKINSGKEKKAGPKYLFGGIGLIMLGVAFLAFGWIESDGFMIIMGLIEFVILGGFGWFCLHVYFKENKAAGLSEKEKENLISQISELRNEASIIGKEIDKLLSEKNKIAAKRRAAEEHLKKFEETGNYIIVDNTPKCPHCGSKRFERIGQFERYIDSTGFGTIAGGGLNSPSLGKTFKCLDCDYRW